MSNLAAPQAKEGELDLVSMKTTAVDQVASLLLSLSLMIGLAVLLLGALYFLSTMKPAALPIVIEEERIAGRGENAAGFERDLEPPAAEEVEQLNEPSIDQTLQSITDAVSSVSATLDTVAATGTSKGDSRPPGPEGEGDDIIPRFERWELRFNVRDSKSYFEQLDFFKIELGVIGGGVTQVDYVKNLGGSLDKRSGKGEDEKRLYFLNRREGPLSKYEKDAVSKAGVKIANGRQVLKLIPKDLEDALAILEKSYAVKEQGRDVSVKEISKTVFESRQKSAKAYEWAVVEQRSRTPKKSGS
jgi:hypothetical protein